MGPYTKTLERRLYGFKPAARDLFRILRRTRVFGVLKIMPTVQNGMKEGGGRGGGGKMGKKLSNGHGTTHVLSDYRTLRIFIFLRGFINFYGRVRPAFVRPIVNRGRNNTNGRKRKPRWVEKRQRNR